MSIEWSREPGDQDRIVHDASEEFGDGALLLTGPLPRVHVGEGRGVVSGRGGYRYCACRDCFEVTMTTGLPEHDLCHECANAGCKPYLGEGLDGDTDCSAPHTYCEGDEAHLKEVWSAAQDGAPVFEGEDARDRALEWAQTNGVSGLRQWCGACGQEF